MFDDFIELDLLDASDPANAMFSSFYLGDMDQEDIHLPLVPDSVDTLPIVASTCASDDEGLVIKQEPIDSPILLNPIPLSPQQTLASDQSPLIFDADMSLITPDQLTIAPQATTVSPSSLTSTSTETIITTASTVSTIAAAAIAPTSQGAVAIDTSKLLKSTASTSTSLSKSSTSASTASTSTTKRASPEPATTTPRKHAKTDSVSSSTTKSKSSSASKKSSSASSSSNAAAVSKTSAGASKSTASTSISSTTAASSSTGAKGKSQTLEPTTESLTSTANTTLSAATLQFLLQQQVETPLIPQLFTGKLTREEIEETLARLLESTKHLIPTPDEEPSVKVKEEPLSDGESENEMEGVEIATTEAAESTTTEGAEPSHGLKTQPGIKTDDIPSSTDLKKMTSKERRQLRNKISARNFRVRRKEYIYTLEGQVLQHKTEARHLREAVTLMQDENQRLKNELEAVRRQLEETTLASATIATPTTTIASTNSDPTLSPELSIPLSKENQSLLASIMNRNVSVAMNSNAMSNITLTMARPQSPILTPNLHKDVPNSSSGSTNQTSWKDKNPIMVHRTLVPEICFGDEFQFDNKPSSLNIDTMDRPWMTFDSKPAKSELYNDTPLTVSELVLELMQTFTWFSTSNVTTIDATSPRDEECLIEADSNVEIDWDLQQSLWALTHIDEEEDMTEEQLSSMQEDPNMIEWLYESMIARLVDLDLQGSQNNTLPESHMA
ncbi:hypothetical protein FBU30_004633 [Linnemannia zychae]|nr:hypothetical protein FBU30_004633 [Linnemannia zychae]